LLRDGGTGAYNPPPEAAWWHDHFTGTAAHNTIGFDGEDQMTRASRFLFAQWPATGDLPDGAWLRDWRGRRHERRVRVEGHRWRVEDRLSGPFRAAALRWRLAPADWKRTENGAESPLFRLRVAADGPLAITLEQGWESPAYARVVPAPVLVARLTAATSRPLCTNGLTIQSLIEISPALNE
jgi:hypothetical protein